MDGTHVAAAPTLCAGGAGEGHHGTHADPAHTESGCSGCKARIVVCEDGRMTEEFVGPEGVEEGANDIATDTHGDNRPQRIRKHTPSFPENPSLHQPDEQAVTDGARFDDDVHKL